MTDETGANQQPQAAGASVGAHARGSRRCPTCGNQVASHARVCPTCGDSLQDRGGRIRCRYCGEKSPAELTLCPYCGRELASAPPRVLTWGVPAVLVVLFLALLVRQVGAGPSPLSWAQERMSLEGVPVENAAERGLVVVVTPAAGNVEVSAQEAPVEDAMGDMTAPDAASGSGIVSASEIMSASEPSAPTGNDLVTAEESAQPSAEQVPTVESSLGDTQESELESPLVSAQQQDAAEDNAADDQPASAAAALQSVAKSEETPTPEATPALQEPVVSAASLTGRAGQGTLPTSTPTNSATSTSVPTSTPTPTATSVATDTPTPVPMPTYQIQRGDTLVVVARKNDVTVEDLMRVNDISAAEAFTIQPGQELLIPVEGSEVSQESPAATDTDAEATPTIAAPTNTPLPTPTTPSLRLDAPILRSPEPGTPLSCAQPGQLAWLPVPFMRTDDQFILHLGFVSGRMEDGRDIVIWVLEQPFPSSAVSWDMDETLCGLAPQEFDRKWHWYLQVVESVDGQLRPVSPESETWYFNWN